MEPTRFEKPGLGFLEGVRQLADEHNCLLIFDEVITGFRISKGGAQEYYCVTPDLATFVKAIANGYPLATGLATLNEITNEPVIEKINETGKTLISDFEKMAEKHELDVDLPGHGFCFTLNFNYAESSASIMTLFIQEMITRGIYTNGVFYPCYKHTAEDIERILLAVDEVFKYIQQLLKCPVRQTGFKRMTRVT